MDRITEKHLQAVVDRINRTAGTPLNSWDTSASPMRANIGNYHLSFAYGGVQLVRHVNEGGGIQVISSGGFCTKRDLYYQALAYLRGLEDCITQAADNDAALNRIVS
jgi:hypothetical protein